MLYAYAPSGPGLQQQPQDAPLSQALWIDLYRPQPEQAVAVEALGIRVPSLADMEEIEVSNRLYRDGDTDVLTVVLPGLDPDGRPVTGPVAFILDGTRLVTVRHHAPRPFETFPAHAGQSSAGCGGRRRIFLGLIEEIVSRLADLLEGVAGQLDTESHRLFPTPAPRGEELSDSLRALGRQGEQVARIRLSLLSLERALSMFGLGLDDRKEAALKQIFKAQVRDIQALAVHADFLSGRIAQLTDVTMGLINLEQTSAARILSVVAVLFLPPTLVASVYGMNFANLPGLHSPLGYVIATALMIGSALGTYLYCKWKGWL